MLNTVLSNKIDFEHASVAQPIEDSKVVEELTNGVKMEMVLYPPTEKKHDIIVSVTDIKKNGETQIMAICSGSLYVVCVALLHSTDKHIVTEAVEKVISNYRSRNCKVIIRRPKLYEKAMKGQGLELIDTNITQSQIDGTVNNLVNVIENVTDHPPLPIEMIREASLETNNRPLLRSYALAGTALAKDITKKENFSKEGDFELTAIVDSIKGDMSKKDKSHVDNIKDVFTNTLIGPPISISRVEDAVNAVYEYIISKPELGLVTEGDKFVKLALAEIKSDKTLYRKDVHTEDEGIVLRFYDEIVVGTKLPTILWNDMIEYVWTDTHIGIMSKHINPLILDTDGSLDREQYDLIKWDVPEDVKKAYSFLTGFEESVRRGLDIQSFTVTGLMKEIIDGDVEMSGDLLMEIFRYFDELKLHLQDARSVKDILGVERTVGYNDYITEIYTSLLAIYKHTRKDVEIFVNAITTTSILFMLNCTRSGGVSNYRTILGLA